MDSKELFLEEFRQLFDETKPEDIQFETVYKEIEEWSSLIVLTLIVHFEDSYGIKLTPSLIEDNITVLDLYNLVK